MAINTPAKRFSAITFRTSWRRGRTYPTGSDTAAHRAALAGYYASSFGAVASAAAGGEIDPHLLPAMAVLLRALPAQAPVPPYVVVDISVDKQYQCVASVDKQYQCVASVDKQYQCVASTDGY